MTDHPDNSAAQAHDGLRSSELIERLNARRTESLGLIDVRRPQQHYANTAGWPAQRFPLLSYLIARYGSIEGSHTSTGLVMQDSKDFSTRVQTSSLPAHRLTESTAGHISPSASRPVSPSASSSTPTSEKLRISRRPPRPAPKPDTATSPASPRVFVSATAPAPSASSDERESDDGPKQIQTTPSLILTKRLDDRPATAASKDRPSVGAAEQLSRKSDYAASSAYSHSTSSRSTTGSPSAQAPALANEIKSGADSNPSQTAPLIQTGRDALPKTSEVWKGSGRMVLRKVSSSQVEAPHEYVRPTMRNGILGNRIEGHEIEGDKIQGAATVSSATKAISAAPVFATPEPTHPDINPAGNPQHGLPLVDSRAAQRKQFDAPARNGSALYVEGSNQLPVVAEINQSSSTLIKPGIIWRKSASISPANPSNLQNTNTSVITRQIDNSAPELTTTQTDETVTPAAATQAAKVNACDLEQVTEQVLRAISRRLTVERERRGIER